MPQSIPPMDVPNSREFWIIFAILRSSRHPLGEEIIRERNGSGSAATQWKDLTKSPIVILRRRVFHNIRYSGIGAFGCGVGVPSFGSHQRSKVLKRNIVHRGSLPMNRSFVVAAFNYWMATLARESRIRCTLRCERGATDHRTLNRGCEHVFYILFLDRVLRVRTTRGFFGQSQRPLCPYQ
jgi:hypothetical protein